jgi:uncharacterized membrane protein
MPLPDQPEELAPAVLRAGAFFSAANRKLKALPMPAVAVALALHIFGAVVWVGGMFSIYVCLRPALGTLPPPHRVRLMRIVFQRFFPWVWFAIILLVTGGYWKLFTTFGGFAARGLHIHAMQIIAALMTAFFLWLFYGLWSSAATSLNRIRLIIAVNLLLGSFVVIIGASGRYWRF